MISTRRTAIVLALTLVVSAFATMPAAAGQTASDFYIGYRAAFDKAESIDQLRQYMSKATLAQVDETPAAERAEMFEMIKMMGTLTDVKVVKETKTDNGATLTVEAKGSEGEPSKGTIEIIEEDGTWKVGKESWTSGP